MTQPAENVVPGGTEPANASTIVDPNAGAVNANTDDAANTDAEGSKPDDSDGLKKALAAERKARGDAEKKLRDQELAKLPELERFKSENEQLTKENEKLALENRQLKIGMRHKLPVSISERLRGDTDDEMEADAKKLLEHYKVDESVDDGKEKKRPPNDGSKQGKPAGGYDMNKLMRIAAGRG